MSQSVEFTKLIELEIDYVSCQSCATNLDFTAESDQHGDIQIYVDRCDCNDDNIRENAFDEGKDEGRQEMKDEMEAASE